MKFELCEMDDATSFDTVGGAGFAADSWFNSYSRGETYDFLIWASDGKWKIQVRAKDEKTMQYLRIAR